MPARPDWTATDPEHSLLFASKGWHLTLAATRPLNVIYFDGSSAANTFLGSLDTQDVVAWGEIRRYWVMEERERIEALCRWSQEHGFDGIVR